MLDTNEYRLLIASLVWLKFNGEQRRSLLDSESVPTEKIPRDEQVPTQLVEMLSVLSSSFVRENHGTAIFEEIQKLKVAS